MKDGIFKYVTENILKIDNLEIFKPYYIEGNITNYRVTDSGEVYSIRKNGKIIKLTPQRQKSGY